MFFLNLFFDFRLKLLNLTKLKFSTNSRFHFV